MHRILDINLIGEEYSLLGGNRAILSVLITFFNVLPESILGCRWIQVIAGRENPVARSNWDMKTFEL